MVGYSLSVADVAIWGTLRGNKIAHAHLKRSNSNVSRWFRFIEETNAWMPPVFLEIYTVASHQRALASAEGGSYDIGLHHAEGGSVTRFPPEPSYDASMTFEKRLYSDCLVGATFILATLKRHSLMTSLLMKGQKAHSFAVSMIPILRRNHKYFRILSHPISAS